VRSRVWTKQVALREGAHIHYRIALCDGVKPPISHCSPISGFILILDFVHRERIYGCRDSLLGEPVSNAWSGSKAARSKSYLDKPHKSLQNCTRLLKTKNEVAAKNNSTKQPTTSSATCLTWITQLICPWLPNRIGVIEGACRHFVKDRFDCLACAGSKQALKTYCACVPWRNDDWTHTMLSQRTTTLRLYGQSASNVQTP